MWTKQRRKREYVFPKHELIISSTIACKRDRCTAALNDHAHISTIQNLKNQIIKLFQMEFITFQRFFTITLIRVQSAISVVSPDDGQRPLICRALCFNLGDAFFAGVTPPCPVLVIVTDPCPKQFLVILGAAIDGIPTAPESI